MSLSNSIAVTSTSIHNKLAALSFDYVICASTTNYNDLPQEVLPPNCGQFLGNYLSNQKEHLEKAFEESQMFLLKNIPKKQLDEIIQKYGSIEISELGLSKIDMINNQLKIFFNNYCAYISCRISQSGNRSAPFFCHSLDYGFYQKETDGLSSIELVLSNIPVIDTDNLSWEKVIEVRQDPEFRQKASQFRTFIHKNYVGKSRDFVIDDFQSKLYEYKKACKKHKLDLKLSTIKQIFNSKTLLASFLVGTVSTIIGEPKIALGSFSIGTFLELGNVVLEIVEKKTELKYFSELSPVAYLYKLRDKTKL